MLERFKVPEQDRVYVAVERIRAATEGILRHSGVPADEAVSSADVLIKNDLREKYRENYNVKRFGKGNTIANTKKILKYIKHIKYIKYINIYYNIQLSNK